MRGSHLPGGGCGEYRAPGKQSGDPYSAVPVASNSALGYGSQRNPYRRDPQEAARGSAFVELQHDVCDLQTHRGGADAKMCGGVRGAGCTVYVWGRYRVTPLNEETLRIAQSKKNNHQTPGEPCKYKLLHGVTGLAFKNNFFQ